MLEDEDDKILNDAMKVAQDERAASTCSWTCSLKCSLTCTSQNCRSPPEEDGQDDHGTKGVCGDIGFHTDEAAAEIPKDDGSACGNSGIP